MNRFAALIDRLTVTASAGMRQSLLAEYFVALPAADRAIAADMLTRKSKHRRITLPLVRAMAEARVDPALFSLSLAFVGDVAETIALLWTARHGANREPSPSEIREALSTLGRTELPKRVEIWLDACDVNGRWALIKFLTATLAPGASTAEVNHALMTAGIDMVPSEAHATSPQAQDDLFANPVQALTPGKITAVLMYVERGRSKSSPTTCTIGVWKGELLLPIGRAKAENARDPIVNFMNANTIKRFGPVREVVHTRDTGLVLTIEFEGLERRLRHKSGIALLGIKITGAHPGKSPSGAGSIEELERLLPTTCLP